MLTWPILTWYAVNTHARAEDKARFNLERQGFDVYLPRYLKKRSHARKTDFVPAPLFPRYLFVGMDLKCARWRAINSTFGVSHLVACGNEPIAVPQGIMNAIHANENENGWVDIYQSMPFEKGDNVQVIHGPMKGHAGLFDGVDDNERVFVLLDLMGRSVKVRMEAENLQAAL